MSQGDNLLEGLKKAHDEAMKLPRLGTVHYSMHTHIGDFELMNAPKIELLTLPKDTTLEGLLFT